MASGDTRGSDPLPFFSPAGTASDGGGVIRSAGDLIVLALVLRLPELCHTTVFAIERLVLITDGMEIGTPEIDSIRIDRNAVRRNFGRVLDQASGEEFVHARLPVPETALQELFLFSASHSGRHKLLQQIPAEIRFAQCGKETRREVREGYRPGVFGRSMASFIIPAGRPDKIFIDPLAAKPSRKYLSEQSSKEVS